MAYTEIKERNGKKYFYRVLSIRKGSRVNKKRIYLGVDLDKDALKNKEALSDKKLKEDKIKESLKKIRVVIVKILKKYRIKKASIFGSYAKGNQKKSSDIDILVEPSKNLSLLDLSGLKIELEKKLGKSVDIVSYKYIHPRLREEILENQVEII